MCASACRSWAAAMASCKAVAVWALARQRPAAAVCVPQMAMEGFALAPKQPVVGKAMACSVGQRCGMAMARRGHGC